MQSTYSTLPLGSTHVESVDLTKCRGNTRKYGHGFYAGLDMTFHYTATCASYALVERPQYTC